MRTLFYRLNRVLALRGWEQSPCVLVRRPGNRFRAATDSQFRVLLLCDGRTELEEGLFSEAEREDLDELIKKGMVVASATPDPIAPWQEYRYYHNRFVRSILWSITGRCNYRCRHCYMDAPDAALGELPHEEAMDLIDQMEQCGVLKVDITGGEPLIRPDFWELVDAMLDRGMAIGMVYTNGWLVDEALLDKFEERGIRPELNMSFDGVGWHDWMRGVKGAEEAVFRAMKLCVARGFPVGVEMCIHKGNVHTLRESVRVLSEIGVRGFKCSGVSDTPLWQKNAEGNAYSFREYCEDMIAYIPQFFEDGCPMNVMLSSVITLYKDSSKYDVLPELHCGTEACGKDLLCGAVRASIYITPDGRLLPCMPMTSCKEQEQFPKIADIGLQKGLSDGFFMEFVDSRIVDLMEANRKCRKCPYVLKCGGGCRARALMQSGDLMGADEDLCMLWHEGYVDRIRQAAEDAIRRFPPKETNNGQTAG